MFALTLSKFENMRKTIVWICILLGTTTVEAQKEDSLVIRRIADNVLTDGKTYSNLEYLCKRIGARLSGSANAQKAVEATFKMMKEAGADTVYLQPCMVPHWVRGAKEQGVIQWGKNKKALHVC